MGYSTFCIQHKDDDSSHVVSTLPRLYLDNGFVP
jgi:hypothetical protein